LPDGSILAKDVVDQTVAFAKEHKISPDAAQKLLETRDADAKAVAASMQESFNAKVEQWAQDARKDPDLAGKDGSAFDATVATAMRARDKFATPAMIKLLNETGFGNHPEVIKLFNRIGAAMKEDTFIPPGAPPPPPAKDVAELFYPSKQP
jgi:hypothetical protein